MRFAPAALNHLIAARVRIEESAEQTNLCLEERISDSRRARYESRIGTPKSWSDWQSAHMRYVEEEVRRRHPLSAAFTPGEPSLRHGMEPNQELYRVERVDRLLRRFGGTSGIPVGVPEVNDWIDAAKSATPAARVTPTIASSSSAAALDQLTDFFNQERNDGRPTFVAFAAEFPGLDGRTDWAQQMCERCGLAHFFADTDVTLALFRYRVQEVLDQATHLGAGVALFAVPTVVDQQMSNIYFTAPPGIHWGHAVGLAPAHDCSHLAAELIHTRIDYKADHWVAVDTLNKPIVSSSEVAALRVKHLDCTQSVHGLATYGTGCV